jgi:hypothetical protein
MSKVCRYKFLVIDDKDIQEINNLKRKTNQAIKHPEPVLKADAPWNGRNEVLDYINVLYDEQEKMFKMWYLLTQGQTTDEFEWNQTMFKWAYATSADGIHWERPILNLIEHNGSKENNYFTPAMNGLLMSIIIDPSDIPARRYKMIFDFAPSPIGLYIRGKDLKPEMTCSEMAWANFHHPLSLAYSADGIHWDRPKHVNPVIRGISDAGYVFYYDADRRKYVLNTRRVPNLPRDVSQYESYDLVNWQDKGRILVAPDEKDPPSLFNLQAFVPFRYEDFYLGMLDVQYSLPGAETYEVFHKPPADYPDQRMGHVEYQLAYSRDGQKWHRAHDRSPVVPVGSAGAPDAGIIFCPLSSPFVINGDTYLYYLGTRYNHSHWSCIEIFEQFNGNKRELTSAMLAKMPEDHWVSLDAGKGGGWFTGKPWGPPHEVFVNADILPGGSIEVELVTPYGQPVPNFTREDCIPVTGNGKNQEIKWKCGRNPWDFQKEYRGGVLTKFYITNAKMYSYTFTLPDPDGQLERYRLNAHWCEYIKHRSDNWGRNSNEPAIGLPPHGGPGPERGQGKPGEMVME